MGKFAYVNGRYVRHTKAAVSIDDRGLLFGDAAYEVFAVFAGHHLDYARHIRRLHFSLQELGIEMPFTDGVLRSIVKSLMDKNKLRDGLVYFQISRGTAYREHAAPCGLKPNVIITTKALHIHSVFDTVKPVRLVTTPDNRWERVDIKTVMLLPNCLAKTKAIREGNDDILFIKDGIVTESSAANFFFINAKGILLTHPKVDILKGITRKRIIECAESLGITVVERDFTQREIEDAKEAFLTSATKLVCPVSHIDGVKVGNGSFDICRELYRVYMQKTVR